MNDDRKKLNTIVADGQEMSWIDTHLTKETMDHLWDCINHSPQKTDSTTTLAGNISKSMYIQDKNNLFYDNVLKEMMELEFYREWNNYYNVHIIKSKPPPVFTLKDIWVNYQKQHEFNPPHNHSGLFSFVVFMKIPTHWKEQHSLPWSENSNSPVASDFAFLLGKQPISISLSPEDEGRMLFFPAWVLHQVYPFYETEEERITLSGNIFIQNESTVQSTSKELYEIMLETAEKKVRSIKEMIKKESETN